MQPDMQDVQQFVAALFAVNSGLERARRRSPQARQLTVLQVIAARPGVSPKEIADDLDLHPSSITRHVQALEDIGYVEIVANPKDRRSCHITLTPAGAQELDRLTQIGFSRFAKFVATWDAEELQTLTRLLMKFEESKAEVSRQEQRLPGRHWQQQHE